MRFATRGLFRSGVFALVSVLFVFATAASSQKLNAKHAAELRSIYPKLDLAFKTKDLKKLTAYYADNFTLSSDGKTLDRAGAIDQWKSVFDFMRSVKKLQTRIEKIENPSGSYLVTYSQSSSGDVQFPGSPVLPYTYESKVTDTWTRSKSGVWKTTSSVEHLSDFKVNGESAKPPN